MTVTPIRSLPCEADQFTGASRPIEATQPLPTVAHLYMRVNKDTDISAAKIDSDAGEFISLVFECPRTHTRLAVAIDEQELGVLWMHAEAARRTKLDGDES